MYIIVQCSSNLVPQYQINIPPNNGVQGKKNHRDAPGINPHRNPFFLQNLLSVTFNLPDSTCTVSRGSGYDVIGLKCREMSWRHPGTNPDRVPVLFVTKSIISGFKLTRQNLHRLQRVGVRCYWIEVQGDVIETPRH